MEVVYSVSELPPHHENHPRAAKIPRKEWGGRTGNAYSAPRDGQRLGQETHGARFLQKSSPTVKIPRETTLDLRLLTLHGDSSLRTISCTELEGPVEPREPLAL